MNATPDVPPAPSPRWQGEVTFRSVTYALVAAAAGWFLLDRLAVVLRPLLLAVFLAYVLMPYHARLRRHVSGVTSLLLLGGATAGVLFVMGLAVYASLLGLREELPRLQGRAVDLIHEVDAQVAAEAPWLTGGPADGVRAKERLAEQGAKLAQPVLNAAADAILEACVVGLYLLFLLVEASRFPERVQKAYSPERADEILRIAGQVNAAVVSYLKAKVKSSLVLAVPVGLVLWGFGVKFALLWAVLTFLCNFIPYIGSVIAYTLPTGFAFLQFDLGWRPVGVAIGLLACQLVSASVLEPMILGKAVGMSPLVILGSLAFWGLLWGIPGMFLAVPLTAVAVIVMGHFDSTRPLARMLGGE
jgi:AI-2 transport protein TqsA